MKRFTMKSVIRTILPVTVFFMMVLIGCDKDEPSGPSASNVGQYAGVWTGTTGQNMTVYFRINASGVVDSLTARIRMQFPTFTCTALFQKDSTSTVQGNSFVAKIRYAGSSNIVSHIRGTFSSSTAAQGTYDGYGGQFSIICGSTFAVGVTGTIISAGTWSATKTGQ